MSEFDDDVSGLYKAGRTGLDLLNVGKVGSMLKTGAGYTDGAKGVLGPLGGVLGAYDAAKGGYNVGESIGKGDLGEGLGGAHDVLTGTAGILGNVPGPVGEVADAFGAGMTVGDMAAPYVFGSEEEDNKPHMEAIPEDGVFKPTCGNQYIDKAIDWL